MHMRTTLVATLQCHSCPEMHAHLLDKPQADISCICPQCMRVRHLPANYGNDSRQNRLQQAAARHLMTNADTKLGSKAVGKKKTC